ncbi:MAG: hypothetical protein SGPRY_010297 [Prymnesium sp.]
MRSDAALRQLASKSTFAFVPDEKTGESLDSSHPNGCVSCFEEEYREGLHAKPLLVSPGVAVLLLDDQAIEGVVDIVRVMDAPSKRVTDLQCPGGCKEGEEEHLKKNHFGMSGSVAYEKGKYRMWVGELRPYYSESVEFPTRCPVLSFSPSVVSTDESFTISCVHCSVTMLLHISLFR